MHLRASACMCACGLSTSLLVRNEDHAFKKSSKYLASGYPSRPGGGGELPKPLVECLKVIVVLQFRKQLIYCGIRLEKFIFTMNAKKPEDRDRKTANDI